MLKICSSFTAYHPLFCEKLEFSRFFRMNPIYGFSSDNSLPLRTDFPSIALPNEYETNMAQDEWKYLAAKLVTLYRVIMP